jgi:hypothetical protein
MLFYCTSRIGDPVENSSGFRSCDGTDHAYEPDDFSPRRAHVRRVPQTVLGTPVTGYRDGYQDNQDLSVKLQPRAPSRIGADGPRATPDSDRQRVRGASLSALQRSLPAARGDAQRPVGRPTGYVWREELERGPAWFPERTPGQEEARARVDGTRAIARRVLHQSGWPRTGCTTPRGAVRDGTRSRLERRDVRRRGSGVPPAQALWPAGQPGRERRPLPGPEQRRDPGVLAGGGVGTRARRGVRDRCGDLPDRGVHRAAPRRGARAPLARGRLPRTSEGARPPRDAPAVHRRG